LENVDLEIFSTIAFLPEKVVKEIENLLDKLFEAHFLENYTRKGYEKEYKNLYKIEDLIFTIGEAMREELGIDPLSLKLYKRIHSTSDVR
jgi:hypothetical protein